MKLALDFDETITLDPLFWLAFTQLARHAKHEVTIVTSRPASYYKTSDYNEDIEGFAKEANVKIIYCDGYPKRTFFSADVWIDDRPESIPLYSQLHTESA